MSKNAINQAQLATMIRAVGNLTDGGNLKGFTRTDNGLLIQHKPNVNPAAIILAHLLGHPSEGAADEIAIANALAVQRTAWGQVEYFFTVEGATAPEASVVSEEIKEFINNTIKGGGFDGYLTAFEMRPEGLYFELADERNVITELGEFIKEAAKGVVSPEGYAWLTEALAASVPVEGKNAAFYPAIKF